MIAHSTTASSSEVLSKTSPSPAGFMETIRQSSLLRFQQHCCNDAFAISNEEDGTNLIFGYWMSLVLVANASARVLFKAHYNITDIKSATPAFDEQNSRPELEMAVSDFMREYCNMVGGDIKSSLESNKIPAGVSLPLVTRGFDEVFATRAIKTEMIEGRWKLVAAGADVTCTLQIEILTADMIEKIVSIKYEAASQEEEGAVDFL